MPAISRFGPLQGSPKNFGMLVGGDQVGASGFGQGLPFESMSAGVERYDVPKRRPMRYRLTGRTLDSTGAVLGNCKLEIFEILDTTAIYPHAEPKGRLVATATSDANGNYTVDVMDRPGVTFQVDAYKSGSPDVAGTTLNTLTGTPA